MFTFYIFIYFTDSTHLHRTFSSEEMKRISIAFLFYILKIILTKLQLTSDIRAVFIIFILFILIEFISLPVQNAISRFFEKQADSTAVLLTEDTKTQINLFKKLAPDYQPQYDLITTIKELKDGLVGMRFKDEDYHNSNLMRIKVLTKLRQAGLITEKLEWVNN